MVSKSLIVFLAFLGITNAIIYSPGLCQPQNFPGTYSALNNVLWHEYYYADPPPVLCDTATFSTYENGTTVIYRRYVDPNNNNAVVNSNGSLQFNSANGQFSLNLAGYPHDAIYYLVDYYYPKSATYYVCIQVDPSNKAESAFVLITDLGYSGDPDIMQRAYAKLSQAGYISQNLQHVPYNTDCHGD